jgi:TrmH family RNA methyltransferase
LRKREGRFLAEGLRLLTDARESGRLPETLVMAEGRDPHPLLDALELAVLDAGGDVIETSEDILSKITGKDNPQAICGVFREFDTSLNIIDRHSAPIWLVAQAMRDPGNLGTMLRTADAVGAGGLILLDDCVDPFSVEAVAPAWAPSLPKNWPWRVGKSFSPGCAAVKAIGGGQPARSGALSRRALCGPCFIMVGNRSRGLPEEYEMACDLRVTMPMKGRADSLNAAVAGAVLAYEVLATLDA